METTGNNMKKNFAAAAFLALAITYGGAFAAGTSSISVTDDLGQTLTLARPAQRVVSLAPHVTELLFAAGAGDKIVATVKYSDFPEAAKQIPRIGDLRQIDLERVIAMKPDLVVVWMHGSFDRQLDKLRQAGVPVFFSEPHKLEDIPLALRKLGQLTGSEARSEPAAKEFQQQISQLQQKYAQRPVVRTFYQVWNKPLYTLNGKHIINDVFRYCGAQNVFASLEAAAPVVNIEAVVKENPELILTGEMRHKDSQFELWKPFSTLHAVRAGNLIALDGDLMNRPGPRIIDGAKQVCEALDQVRQKRTGMK